MSAQHHLAEHQRPGGIDAEADHAKTRNHGQARRTHTDIRNPANPCITKTGWITSSAR